MKTATAKELRIRAASILENVKRGEEITITMRGKSIAVLTPFNKIKRQFNPVGFGIWKGRKGLKDVSKWVDERRKERFQR